jgi:hypothetical protein
MKKLEHAHDLESIRQRLRSVDRGNYLRDFIYGSIDGIVKTFAIIAGVAGAGLDEKTIILLGFANILADGFSHGREQLPRDQSRGGRAREDRRA